MLKKLWRGDFSLARTYWLYNLAIPLLFILIFGMFYLKWVALLAAQNNMASAYIAYFAFRLLLYSYGIIATVGLWRSSARYTGPASWRFLGKATVWFAVIAYVKDYWSLFKALFSQEAFLALLEPIIRLNQL